MMEIDISAENALDQAVSTADLYLSKAYKILEEQYENWTVRDAIELSKIMAQDYHTCLIGRKIQEIRDAIEHHEKG